MLRFFQQFLILFSFLRAVCKKFGLHVSRLMLAFLVLSTGMFCSSAGGSAVAMTLSIEAKDNCREENLQHRNISGNQHPVLESLLHSLADVSHGRCNDKALIQVMFLASP